jgi:hypothetical protein
MSKVTISQTMVTSIHHINKMIGIYQPERKNQPESFDGNENLTCDDNFRTRILITHVHHQSNRYHFNYN